MKKYSIIIIIIIALIVFFSFILKNKSLSENEPTTLSQDNLSATHIQTLAMGKTKLSSSTELLKSFFNNSSDYEKAFSKSCPKKTLSVIAGITSHHFLAKDAMACFYKEVSNDSIENVLLIGPDHFHTFDDSAYSFFTTKLNWTTPFGQLDSNTEIIDELLNNKNIKLNDNVFRTEHSIYTEIPFIKKVFPNAKVTPIIIKNTRNYQDFIDFGKKLHQLNSGNKKTIMIVSSDFTHNETLPRTKDFDKKSIATLKNISPTNLNEINCDCRSCLAVMLGFINEDKEFKLVSNISSANLGGGPTNITSYVMGYYLKNEAK